MQVCWRRQSTVGALARRGKDNAMCRLHGVTTLQTHIATVTARRCLATSWVDNTRASGEHDAHLLQMPLAIYQTGYCTKTSAASKYAP